MKDTFLAIERRTTAFALFVSCAMLVVAAALGFWQIVTRFVLEQPAEWTEVLIRFSLIYMVFFGIAAAFRYGAMVSVDVLYRWAAVSIFLLVLVVWIGWDYAQRGKVQTVAGLESVSMFWAYLAMPLGGVFAILGALGNALDPRREELETAQ